MKQKRVETLEYGGKTHAEKRALYIIIESNTDTIICSVRFTAVSDRHFLCSLATNVTAVR